MYRDWKNREAELLSSAYRKSLELAVSKGLKSIAFPSISTGAYGYPINEAAEIALRTVIEFIKANRGFELVRFVLFSERDLAVYEESLKKITQKK
ncbi:MAG: macro domain-containing protein [Nitrospirae bacterium]|nr:macro domain-containing protein [Nitrospirota bacterium]